MDIGTVIDPITNKTYESYVSRNYWVDTTNYRYGKDGRLHPEGLGSYVTITLEKMSMSVQDYFEKNPMIKNGYPLMVKFEQQTWLGVVRNVGPIDHGGDTVFLTISLLEVGALRFAERVDDIYKERA